MATKSDSTSKQLKESVRFIRQKAHHRPSIGIILGSGLGDYADTLLDRVPIETHSIPHYPHSTVEGHRGCLVFGKLHTASILAFQGRVHYYESGTLSTVVYPILIANRLGIKTLILTNAAGGINPQFHPADLMVIDDHINFTFLNPLSGIEEFPPQKKNDAIYHPDLREMAIRIAQEKGISVRRGVYCGLKGPSYETASEVKMTRMMGADAVGMSTVNEATLAHALGMRVLGISCITNLSTGITGEKLSHAEVTEVANQVKHSFGELLTAIISEIASHPAP